MPTSLRGVGIAQRYAVRSVGHGYELALQIHAATSHGFVCPRSALRHAVVDHGRYRSFQDPSGCTSCDGGDTTILDGCFLRSCTTNKRADVFLSGVGLRSVPRSS